MLKSWPGFADAGDIVLWLGYLMPRPFGPSDRDVCPGVQDRPEAARHAGAFFPVRCYGTKELLHHGAEVRREVQLALAEGRRVWVSLAGCEATRTVERARRLDPASADSISSFLRRCDLAPTATDCLWNVTRALPVDTVGSRATTRLERSETAAGAESSEAGPVALPPTTD